MSMASFSTSEWFIAAGSADLINPLWMRFVNGRSREKDAAPPSRVWTRFTYGFHLATSNSVDLSSITLTLLPYDPALAEQIRATVVPAAAHTRKHHGAVALRRLIAAIQVAAPTVGRDFEVQDELDPTGH